MFRKRQKMEKPSILPLLPLYTVIFIGFIGYSLMITIFTPLLAGSQSTLLPDAEQSERLIILGILLALYPAGQFFGSPVLGALSDRFGRKPILIISLCITTLCYIFIALALERQSLFLLMPSLLVAGLGEANVAISQSAIADISTKANRSRLFGYTYMAASAAYIVGPLVGGKLADPQLVSWFNSATPFWGVFCLLVLTSLWIVFYFKEKKPQANEKRVNYLRAFIGLGTIFTHPRLRLLYLVNFLIYTAIFGFFRCYPMYLVDRFHMGVSRVSEFIAWVAVPIVIANLGLNGFLARRFSLKKIIIATAILTGIFMPFIIVSSSPNVLWLTLFLTGMALALCMPASAALLSVTADSNEQGSVMGNNQALNVGAQAISGIAGGLLATLFTGLPLIVLGVVAILSGLILLIWSRHRAIS
jgi:DHA1 family tetracycline resistance protein-like MFS transporter